MNDTEKLSHATAILSKMFTDENGGGHFESWPTGDGFLQWDTQVELTEQQVVFLSSFRKPELVSGPGGMPDDYDEDEGLR